MVEKNEAVRNLYDNIQFIKKEHGLGSDSDLCKATGIAKGTLSAVKSGEKIPMIYPFFYQLCNYSGYTVDELIGRDLMAEKGADKADGGDSKEQELNSYVGVYAAYYYNTSSVKGRERKDDDEALKYAVVLVYRGENGEYLCCGDFGLTREEQISRFNSCFTKNELGKTKRNRNFGTEYINRYFGPNIYSGTFTINENSIVFKLESSQDSLTMMLNRIRNTPPKYLGGLAAALSVCSGVYPVPVMQVVGLSRGLLTESASEIGGMLLLGYPRIECRREDEKEIFDMIHSIIDGHGERKPTELSAHRLTMDQEQAILLAAMNRAINNTVKRNLGRTIQVTAMDEEPWYFTVRRFEET